jgi:hypothetical protein
VIASLLAYAVLVYLIVRTRRWARRLEAACAAACEAVGVEMPEAPRSRLRLRLSGRRGRVTA